MKRQHYIILIVAFIATSLISIHSQAQELRRKGSLGISMAVLTDSIADQLNIEKGKGLFIRKVFPNTTASKIGMKDGAVLTKLNGREVNTIPDLLAAISDLHENDAISFTFFQDGKYTTKKAKAVGRPKETSEKADVLYEQVAYTGNKLRSILYIPKGAKKPPVVFYMQGYTCGSVEFSNFTDHTSMQLINDWVDAGYAVYRVEKPGVGDSDCDKGCLMIDFNEEVEAFRQAYMHLAQDTRIDADNIFLFGHSMGGIIAPILAKEFTPKGVIPFGIMVNSWFEYMQELTRIQGEMFHTPYAEIDDDLRNSLPFWYALYVAQKSNAEILQDTAIKNILEREGILADFENGQFMDRHYTYWATLNQVSLFKEWMAVESNVLALYGEFDVQALNAKSVKTIANLVNANHPGKGSYIIVPKTDHGFVRFNSMQENIDALTNGQYFAKMQSDYNPATANITIEWMNSLLD
jgi:pimeloyl-ACP methyl ester carboxylesterase